MMGKRNNVQNTYPREKFHYNSEKGLSNLMLKFTPNQILDGKNDKTGEAKRGQRGTVRGIRNLSYQELMDRRAKGLCFKRKQHYSPTHHCPKKGIKVTSSGR